MQNNPGGRITPPDGTPTIDIRPDGAGKPPGPPPSPFARKPTEVAGKQGADGPDMNLPAAAATASTAGNGPSGGAVVPAAPAMADPPASSPPAMADPPASSPAASSPAASSPPAGPPQAAAAPARVKGRIDIADEVIEKVAAAAAYEVEGVADLGSDVGSALERMRERIGIGKKDDSGGVGVDIAGGEAEIDVPVTVKYGHALIDVARRVQANVAHQLNLMLGLKITAVNVTIDDIEMPEDALSYKDDDGQRGGGGLSISV